MKKHMKIWNAEQGIQGRLCKVHVFLNGLCIHEQLFSPVHSALDAADILITFHITLLQNVKHTNSNMKPSQIINSWRSIWNYGMPNRESKEGFAKFILFSKKLMHSLTTFCTHAFCTCCCRCINYLSHKPFTKFKAN